MLEQPWKVWWPTQKIVKEVGGEIREVEVVGGSSTWSTYERAREEVERHLLFWPGLQIKITRVEERAAEGGTLRSSDVMGTMGNCVDEWFEGEAEIEKSRGRSRGRRAAGVGV